MSRCRVRGGRRVDRWTVAAELAVERLGEESSWIDRRWGELVGQLRFMAANVADNNGAAEAARWLEEMDVEEAIGILEDVEDDEEDAEDADAAEEDAEDAE